MASAVDGLRAGLKGVAHDDVVNRFGSRSCFLKSALNGDGSKFLGADGFEGPTGLSISALATNPFAERGSSTANNHHIIAHATANSPRGMNITLELFLP